MRVGGREGGMGVVEETKEGGRVAFLCMFIDHLHVESY